MLYVENICKELSSVHALTLILIRIFILQTHSLHVCPPPIIIFSYSAEICPLLVQLIGYLSALIGYIEIQVFHHDTKKIAPWKIAPNLDPNHAYSKLQILGG